MKQIINICYNYNDITKCAINKVNNNKILISIEDAKCIICMKEYIINDELKILPCNDKHHYHAPCTDIWLRYNNKCPLCRMDITEVLVV